MKYGITITNRLQCINTVMIFGGQQTSNKKAYMRV